MRARNAASEASLKSVRREPPALHTIFCLGEADQAFRVAAKLQLFSRIMEREEELSRAKKRRLEKQQREQAEESKK